MPVWRGTVILALVTLTAYRLHLNAAAAGFVYLTAIVLNCIDSGFIAAAIVSVLAVACLDFFFIQAVLTWTVADPVDMVALASFLITSLVVTNLASRARNQARTAKRERQNTEQLYELAQRLLALDPLGTDQSSVLESVRVVFGLKATCIFDASAAEVHLSGDTHGNLGERTREAYILGQDTDEPVRGIAVRCLKVSGKTAGAIGFEGLEDRGLMAGPLAALAAAGLERANAVRSASHAAAIAEAEDLRAAILDALAHEFKTPLATILTATGGLREAGPLGSEQTELAEIVEAEAERLSRLSSRLLRLAKLDREEVKPRLEPVDISSAVASSVDRYSRQWADRQISFTKRGEPDEILADAELLQLALSQLLDNACRYSPQGSSVHVSLEGGHHFVVVTVWNGGCSLPLAEGSRIFQRYYRGAEARRTTTGSGLGLYVARKIALAHGGSLDLDNQQAVNGGVAFRLTMPFSSEGSSVAASTS